MAVVEVPKVKIEKIGLKPFHEFDDANETWPRGDRPAAIREAATEFRARFATPENRVRAVRTVPIASAGDRLAYNVLSKIWHTVPSALAEAGLRPEDVDFVSFDHLHVQDVRFILGSETPPPGH